MQSSMSTWARLRPAVAVMATTWGLAACGGGGGSDATFEVTLTVNGVADAANPMSVGETTNITVPSGAALVFESNGDSAWTLVNNSTSYDVETDSARGKSVMVTSNGGGIVSIVFANVAKPSQISTLNVLVQPKHFERVAMTAGEVADWDNTVTLLAGGSIESPYRHRSVLIGSDGSYGQDSANALNPDDFTYRYLFDAQDRQTGYQELNSSYACSYTVPLAEVSYPLFVGKTWSLNTQRICNDSPDHVRGVEAVNVVDAFESVTVAAGTFDALRIRSETTYSGLPDSSVPGGSFTASGTCWWAVAIGRQVKCEATMQYPAGTPDTRIASQSRSLKAFNR